VEKVLLPFRTVVSIYILPKWLAVERHNPLQDSKNHVAKNHGILQDKVYHALQIPLVGYIVSHP
jgi:hypothetical protein